MNLTIGRKIKELRKAQDITQEKLANYLSISSQAISKWENETAYPDITLIPSIASFFDVSADELLGINLTENVKEFEEAEEVYRQNKSKGKIDGNIKISREILEKYPRNFQWMLNLAEALTDYNGTQEQLEFSLKNNFTQEAISLCERIKEDCTEDSIRFKATEILCKMYPLAGKTEDALRLVNDMPSIFSSKEILLSAICTGEERIKQNQENLILLIDLCANTFVKQAFDRECGKNLSCSEKARFVESANILYKTLFDGDEDNPILCQRLSWNYRRLAELKCADQDNERAMEYLFLAEKTAKIYDSEIIKGKQKFKSLFVNRCAFVPENTEKNWEGSEVSMLYYRTTESVFCSLRKNKAFKELQKRLKATLGSFEKELPSVSEAED